MAGTASVSAVILTRDDSVELVADDRAVSCQLTETLPDSGLRGWRGAGGLARVFVGPPTPTKTPEVFVS